MTDKKTKGLGDRVVQAIKGEGGKSDNGPHVDAEAVREMAQLAREENDRLLARLEALEAQQDKVKPSA